MNWKGNSNTINDRNTQTSDKHLINNTWTHIILKSEQRHWNWIHMRPWRQETRNTASSSISTSPTSTGATVVSWEMREGEWGLEMMVDVDPSITSEAGRHSRHQKYWSASVLLSSDGWRWAESVRGGLSWPGRNPSCLCLMWKIDGLSGGKEHLDCWSTATDLWCLDSHCSQFSVFMLYLQTKVRH